MTSLEYVQYLTETIGPRGSTRPGEAESARYVADVLTSLGLHPVTEAFISARSKYSPYVVSAAIGLIGVALFWQGNLLLTLVAIALLILNLISVALHLCSVSNPLRWLLPRGASQNVHACLPSSVSTRRKIVLLAHLDSNRTPLLNSSAAWLRIYALLLPAALCSGIALIALFVVGLANPDPILRLLSIPPALVFLLVLALMLQADFTLFTVGANDNASSVGVALSLAGRLSRQPLSNTEVWAVFDGCEEVSLYGADAFVRAHRDELRDALWIVLDSVGGAGGELRYTESETLLLTVASDPELVRIFDDVARAHPEWRAQRLRFKTGANATDGTMLALRGMRQIAVVAPGPNTNELLQIHRVTDDLEHIDPALLERCESLLWEVLQTIDGQSE